MGNVIGWLNAHPELAYAVACYGGYALIKLLVNAKEGTKLYKLFQTLDAVLPVDLDKLAEILRSKGSEKIEGQVKKLGGSDESKK